MHPRAYLLLSVLIPLLGALLASNAMAAPVRVDQPVIAGSHALIQHPAHATNRVVVYVHGAGERAADVNRVDKTATVARLLREGYTVASIDAHGDNWGNAQSVEDYVNLVDYLRNRGLTRVYVLALSMGGIDGLRLIDRIHPVAWAGIFPVCNLAVEARDPRLISSIRAAHPQGLPQNLSPIRPSRVRGLRMMFWASYGDTTVPRAANTDVCASYARRHGAEVQVITTRGDHGNKSNYEPGRLAAFFAGR